MNEKYKEYLELERQRAAAKGESLDDILDRMDKVWLELTDEEHRALDQRL